MSNQSVAVPQQDQKAIQKSKLQQLKNIMAAPSVVEQFQNVLKENSGSFVASIIDLFNNDSKLQECDPPAVVSEALKAAALKLPINKSLGFAYVVGYKGVPQMQVGYKGYIQLAMRTGEYKILNADEVYEGEFVRKNKLTGEFDLSGERTGDKVVGYFAHFELRNGFAKTLYMETEEVRKWGAKYSPSYSYNSSPWKKEFDKMAIKTVLRNLLSHWGYMSIEMVNAMNNDGDFNAPVESVVQDEINSKANSKPLEFEEANVVEENDQKESVAQDNNGSSEQEPEQKESGNPTVQREF